MTEEADSEALEAESEAEEAASEAEEVPEEVAEEPEAVEAQVADKGLEGVLVRGWRGGWRRSETGWARKKVRLWGWRYGRAWAGRERTKLLTPAGLQMLRA